MCDLRVNRFLKFGGRAGPACDEVTGIMQSVGRSGVEGDLDILLSPGSFPTLTQCARCIDVMNMKVELLCWLLMKATPLPWIYVPPASSTRSSAESALCSAHQVHDCLRVRERQRLWPAGAAPLMIVWHHHHSAEARPCTG